MWRFKFIKRTQINARDYAPGAEGDFCQDDTDELLRVGAGEVIGPASEYAESAEPEPAETTPKKRSTKPKKATP